MSVFEDFVQQLLSFVKSRGGSLEINAHFKECDVPISLGVDLRKGDLP